MTLPFHSPPESLCILRLSAVGDISHTLPVVRTIQSNWPQTKLTWIIGKTEYGLVYDIPDIEFIQFDKSNGWREYLNIRQTLKGRRFDALLHMQMSLRASMIAMLVSSPVKLGFDRQRAKDLQWLFSNHNISYKPQQHVIDSFFCFAEALGIEQHQYIWDLPVPDEARQFAADKLPADRPLLVISPCSSMAYRNWTTTGYAQVADYANDKYGLQVVLCGGPSTIEKEYAASICRQSHADILDLIGKTSLKQLLAVLEKARVVIAPDSGPAHLATALQIPVIGLYASTNPDRACPYLSRELVVSHYAEAVHDKFHTGVDQVPWGTRVRDAGTMERISVAEVNAMLDKVMITISSEEK